MNAYLEAIKLQLKARPDHMYVSPQGTELYVLTKDDQILVMLGENLHLMNETEINKFFQDTLAKLF